MSRKGRKRKSNARSGSQKGPSESVVGRFTHPAPVNTRKRESDSSTPESTRSGWRWARLARFLFFLCFTASLITVDTYFAWEKKVSDALVNFTPIPPKDKQVVIVGITDEDYRTQFNSSSPLSPAVVTQIIDAISNGEPKVLGIDLLTSDEVHKTYHPRESTFPIVWAEEAVKNDESEIQGYKGPLGGQELPSMNYAALPEVPIDTDGTFRFFWRALEVNGGVHPAFAWRTYQLAKPHEAETKTTDTDGYYVQFSGRKQQDVRSVISASQILKASLDGHTEELKQLLKDKIVLLGGMFRDSRDKGTTSFGELYGVEIHASIIETELQGSPRKVVPFPARMLINLFMFLLFTVNFSYIGFHWKAVVIAATGIAGLSVVLSVSQYGNLAAIPLTALVLGYGLLAILLGFTASKTSARLLDTFADHLKKLFGR